MLVGGVFFEVKSIEGLEIEDFQCVYKTQLTKSIRTLDNYSLA
jgi:hypothetical protein